MTRRTYIAAIAALTILAAVRVASTHRVFSETIDEPVHLAMGWKWLRGDQTGDISHPPLARIFFALPLQFAGVPDPPEGDDVEQGNFLLYHGDRYVKHLARGRIGNLLMLAIAILAVAEQARRAFGRGIALLATALYTTLPPLLGHAGLMTTDVAVAAAIPLALLALDRFLEAQTLQRAIALGAAIAFGVLAKFSFFVFFPAAALVLIVVRRPMRPRARTIGVGLLVAFVVVWGGYHFDFGTMSDVFHGAGFFVSKAAPDALMTQVRWIADHVPIPAPALPAGFAIVKNHDEDGHLAFLLGDLSDRGWWYYFPVIFFFKTPLAFLLLAAAGIVLSIKHRRAVEHALMPLAILLVVMTSSINIGIRHILPMYGSLAIVAAYAVVHFRRNLLTYAVVAWLFLATAAAHPDYLAYFNEAAGKRPARIAVDSNLDWGQDVLRLERAAREMKLEHVWVRYWTNARFDRHSIPGRPLPDSQRVSGWIAVGETAWAMEHDKIAWLDAYEPVRMVGKSIRLYYVP